MDMLPNCTNDACNGFHKSATKKQFYDARFNLKQETWPYNICL